MALTKDPFSKNGVNHVEGKYEDGNGEIRHSQGDDEEILHDSKGFVCEYAQDD